MRWLIGLVALFAALPASGQGAVPDTTNPARYYPLDLGNEWLYATREGRAYTETVVGDTVLAGHAFTVVDRVWIRRYDPGPDPQPTSTRFFVRIDSATAHVVFRDGEGVETTDGCPLGTDFPADLRGNRDVMCGATEATVSGGYGTSVELGVLDYESVPVRASKAFTGPRFEQVAYAAGLGRVTARGAWGVSEYDATSLVRATIRGEEFGPPVVPDTTDPAAYYPLEVGNVWEMRRVISGSALTRTRREVVRDTTVGGTRYAVMESAQATSALPEEPEGWGPSQIRLLRYDSLTTRIMERLGDSEEVVTCPLGAGFGDVLDCAGQVGFLHPAGVVSGSAQEGDVPVGEERAPITAWKMYHDLAFYADTGSDGAFGAGVGPLPQTDFAFCQGCREDLTYLRLVDDDGTVREYGARWATPTEPAPGAARLGVRAFPSPASGPVTVAVSVPEAARLTVEAVDALGRRVWHAEVEAPPGEHRLGVDAGAWAPGLYVVRATAGPEAVSTTVVLR